MIVLAATLLMIAPATEHLRKAEYVRTGRVWPFTVPAVEIGCNGVAPWVQAKGRRYALNGRARAQYPYADPILAVDAKAWNVLKGLGSTNRYKPRIDAGEVLQRARRLCTG